MTCCQWATVRFHHLCAHSKQRRRWLAVSRGTTTYTVVSELDDPTWPCIECLPKVVSDFVGEQSRVHIMPISAKWKHKSSIHIGFMVFNGGVTTFLCQECIYILSMMVQVYLVTLVGRLIVGIKELAYITSRIISVGRCLSCLRRSRLKSSIM